MSEPSGDLQELTLRMDRQWVRLGRFFLSRKARCGPHEGAAVALSPIQLQALSLLFEGSVRIGALAELLGIAESTASRLADRLEELGLALRSPERGDRRHVDVELTAEGLRAARDAREIRRAILADMLLALTPRDRLRLVRLMEQVVEVLDRSSERALPAGVG
jgi:DNA-binding MarR family transcriptional regulator